LQEASLQCNEGEKHLRQNEHGNINTMEVKIGETSPSIRKFGKGDGLNIGHYLLLFMH
jgi:hypothetical protein